MRLKECLRACDRGLACLVLMAGCALLALCVSSCTSFERLTKVVEQFPQARACGECHVDIYREWSESPHARAYTNPRYREGTDDYRFAACIGCHAPIPTVTEATPPARAAFREEGVTCVSCHLEEQKMLGPIIPTGKVAPHPVGVVPDRYRNSRFCGRCHTGTFAEWSAVKMEKKPTCQECHMPATKRKLTQATSSFSKAIVAMEQEVPQKRHTFTSTPKDLESPPFTVTVVNAPANLKLTIRNNLAHAVPTGDFGIRIVVLDAILVDAKGTNRFLGQRELVKQLGTALQPQSSFEWKLPAQKNARSLLVRMRRRGAEGGSSVELFKTEVPLR